MSLIHSINIGDITVPGNVFLAPMAGYTDIPFRTLCLENGAFLTFSEMVSSEGLARDSVNTVPLMKRAENEDMFAIQIFQGNLDSLERGLDKLLQAHPTIIDINCGCPVPKVVKTNAGSALMKDPLLMGRMVAYIKKNCDIPVSVKFRLGWDSQSENFLEFARIAMDNGCDMLTMHARTKSQGYAPFAHWDRLKTLAENMEHKVPVIGSGDLFKAEDVKRMMEETGVDGVMLARGTIGNPFIFRQTIDILNGNDKYEITMEDRFHTIRRHLELMVQQFGEKKGCTEMRKHCSSYFKGIANTSKLRQKLVMCSTVEEYDRTIAEFRDHEPQYN